MISNTCEKNALKNVPDAAAQSGIIDIAAWIRFIREMRLPKIFSGLPDKRQPGKILYPLSSLVLWAFSACAFRCGSKNALQTSLEGLNSTQRQGMLNLLGIERDRLPNVSTVDNALAQIPLESLNQIPLDLIKQLEKRKFFYNHPELLPDNALHVGCDGFWMHTYDHPHAINEDGSNACPYCLPRTRNKGTEQEKTQWVHVTVTFVLICQGVTLPLYIYPLKAGQVDIEQSDDKLKEECELKATHAILPMIRERFPRITILFLGDALYANRPTIRLCDRLNIGYIIVLKENTLKTLNARCDELAKTQIYQSHHTREVKENLKQGIVKKQAS
jgi:uncharacterized Zn-finger protein